VKITGNSTTVFLKLGMFWLIVQKEVFVTATLGITNNITLKCNFVTSDKKLCCAT
jgi:hypothetical protein